MNSTTTISQVWAKACIVDMENERLGFRKDQCGAWIKYGDYGDRTSPWGWEIDHIMPVSQGGANAVSNLRPLNWHNNAAKSDGRLVCSVTSYGTTNVAA